MTRVKICGITNLEDALAACDAGADALGFVFAPEAKKRNRYIEPDAAREIIARLPPYVMTVAVCVNAPENAIRDYLEFVDRIQFHGEETREECNVAGARGIKVFRAGPSFTLDAMCAFPTRGYLLDAYVPGQRGGTGAQCDWVLARRAVGTGRPIILAGGLTPENAAEAVRRVRPYAVDASGGVESAPGKKDHERIRKFIENVRNASLA